MSETGERRMTIVEAVIYWNREERLDRLVHNLIIAAALCEAFRVGEIYGYREAEAIERGCKRLDLWRPGCGRSAL